MNAMTEIEVKPKDLIPISIALLAIILFGLLVSNQWALLSAAQGELKEEKALFQSLESKKDFIIELEAEEDELIREFEILRYKMPNHTEHVGMLDYLQSIFIKYNLHVNQVRFDERIDKEGYSEMPMQISLDGEYNQIIDFLRDFRFGDKIFRVDEFSMNIQESTSSQIYCDIVSFALFKTSSD